MAYIKSFVGENSLAAGQFLVLAGIATLLPFLFHFQWVTGPIVNAILIITLFLLGLRSAVLMCVVPSLMAIAGGLIPQVMAPAIPFIMIGNIILVLSVERLSMAIADARKGYWLGVALGATGKYLFLLISVQIVARLFVEPPLTEKVALMFSWPQLVTALTGGLIAWGVLSYLKRV